MLYRYCLLCALHHGSLTSTAGAAGVAVGLFDLQHAFRLPCSPAGPIVAMRGMKKSKAATKEKPVRAMKRREELVSFKVAVLSLS